MHAATLRLPRTRRVGDEKWIWTFAQMTDLAYVWVTSSDTIPTGPTGGGLVQVSRRRLRRRAWPVHPCTAAGCPAELEAPQLQARAQLLAR